MALFQFVKAVLSCISCWCPSPTRKDVTPQAVLACTFGRGGDGTQGKSNEALASAVEEVCRMRQLPFCVQAEVGLFMKSTDNDYVSANTYDYHQKGYVGTHETVQEMVEKYCIPRHIRRVIVVAHPHHAWRVVKVCEQWGLEVVEVDTEGIPYDPDSTQRWCRSAWNGFRTFPYPPFVLYEIAARLLYFLRGWLFLGKVHYMHLNSEAVRRMQHGIKRIEVRLNDRQVRPGDIIQFLREADGSYAIRVRVRRVRRCRSPDALLERLRHRDTPEGIHIYGVVGIEVEPLLSFS